MATGLRLCILSAVAVRTAARAGESSCRVKSFWERGSIQLRFASRVQKVQSSAIRDLLRYGTDPSIISFGGGYPDPSLFPAAELQAVYNQVLAEHSSEALQYTVSDGIPALRAHIAQRMTEDGTPCGMDDVLVLQGAQQGLDFVAKMLLE